MVRVATLALALGLVPACQVVFPLDSSETKVDGTLSRRFVHNDDQFLPVAEPIPFTAQELTATAVLDDGVEVPVDWDYATGAFTFERESGEQAYRLIVDLPEEGFANEYLSDQRHLTLAVTEFGRPDQIQVAAETSIKGVIGNVDWSITTNTLVAFATGTWAAADLPVNRVDTFDYDGEWSGPRVEPAKHDRLHFLAYESNGTGTSISAVIAVDDPIVDGINTINAGVDSVASFGCVHFGVQRSAELIRVGTSYPQYQIEETGWSIQALPAPQLGVGGRIGLEVSENLDEIVQAGYNQPFTGMSSFAVMTVERVRSIGSLELRVGVERYLEAPMDCPDAENPPNLLLASGTVAIANRIELAGEPLDQEDDHPIAATAPQLLTWDRDTTDPDFYTVTLFDITDETKVKTHEWLTTGRTITVDPSLLVANRSYLFEIVAQAGFAGAATGNFEELSYPFSRSVAQSMSFTPTN